MNRQYEQRLRRLEQKENEATAMKKQWLPQWLLDRLSKAYGLPFDTEEKGIESIRRIQRDKIVVPDDDDCIIEQQTLVPLARLDGTQSKVRH